MNIRDYEDDDLIKMAISGDMAAFEEIYFRYRAYAFGVARRHLRDYHMAEDVTQEAFAKLLCKFHLFVGTGRFKSFLASIVSNMCKDILRKRSALSLDLISVTEGDSILVDPKQVHPIDKMIKVERIAAVREVIKNLPPTHSSLINGYWYDDMRLAQLAYKFNLPLGTVKSMIYGAMRKMQGLLEGN